MKAVAIGELAVDWLSLNRGENFKTAKNFYRYLGGNATNVAVGTARLGMDSALVSRVGNDIHGHYVLDKLKTENVDTTYVSIDSDHPTAQCYMTSQIDGTPEYLNWPSQSASKSLKVEHVDNSIYEQSWIWHTAAVTLIARPRRDTLMELILKAVATGKILSFDGCFPDVESEGGRKAAYELMKKSDIIKINLQELCYWSQSSKGSSIAEMVGELSKKINPQALLIITLAERGAELWKEGKNAFCPPYKVDSIGDVGPGDGFASGLIYGLSLINRGHCSKEQMQSLSLADWLEIARYGAVAGAMVTRSRSATESFPHLEELQDGVRTYTRKA